MCDVDVGELETLWPNLEIRLLQIISTARSVSHCYLGLCCAMCINAVACVYNVCGVCNVNYTDFV